MKKIYDDYKDKYVLVNSSNKYWIGKFLGIETFSNYVRFEEGTIHYIVDNEIKQSYTSCLYIGLEKQMTEIRLLRKDEVKKYYNIRYSINERNI